MKNATCDREAVTTADEWRAVTKGVWLVTLASGKTVRARRLDVGDALRRGLTTVDKVSAVRPNDLFSEDVIDVARACAPLIVVQPRLVPSGTEPKDGEIGVDEVQIADLVAILTWGLGMRAADVSGMVSERTEGQ